MLFYGVCYLRHHKLGPDLSNIISAIFDVGINIGDEMRGGNGKLALGLGALATILGLTCDPFDSWVKSESFTAWRWTTRSSQSSIHPVQDLFFRPVLLLVPLTLAPLVLAGSSQHRSVLEVGATLGWVKGYSEGARSRRNTIGFTNHAQSPDSLQMAHVSRFSNLILAVWTFDLDHKVLAHIVGNDEEGKILGDTT
ncbi:hypothetical protein EDD18DRAFT_1348137 [Armillaria luteobubalina]|uniref:Uncharacterized protein n=1 Tax=Armillaria luteobubalina TaxID=153913 RepID=A0AA39QFI2_9AGAR|nr:hypothetical protein EDD18DRAFT_1348137 [Armillaria luteobubalina]